MSPLAIQLQRRPEQPPRQPAISPAVVPPPPLLEQMPGEPCEYLWNEHRVHYRVLGSGPPLVLVHTPDVGSSCLEWRRNIEPLSATFTVFAVDLPGFGRSDARPLPYTADLYIRFLADFLWEVTGPGARVIGSGLGASYLVHTAVKRPDCCERMALVAPAGLSAFRPHLFKGVAFQMLRLPWLHAVCDSALSRLTILEHLQKDIYANDQMVSQGEADVRYWVAHRPNAEYVERSRIAGMLNADIRSVVPQLRQPALLLWGRQASRPPIADAETFCELKPDTAFTVFERSGLCPHQEESHHFNELICQFLASDTLSLTPGGWAPSSPFLPLCAGKHLRG